MIKHPYMREELFQTLSALSDVEYQRQVWVNHEFPPGIEYDCFDAAVHFLFDDTRLAEAPEQTIGWILENQVEAQAVSKVTRAIDALLDKMGTELKDEDYINSPEWPTVVKAASEALAVLSKNPA